MNNEFYIEDGMIMEYLGKGGELVLPEDANDIFFFVFTGDVRITGVTVPRNIPELTPYAFEGCPALTRVKLCEGVKQIGCGAFSDCRALTSVILPKSLELIEKNAFSGCKELAEIRFAGSADDWKRVKKNEDWDKDTGDYKLIFAE